MGVRQITREEARTLLNRALEGSKMTKLPGFTLTESTTDGKSRWYQFRASRQILQPDVSEIHCARPPSGSLVAIQICTDTFFKIRSHISIPSGSGLIQAEDTFLSGGHLDPVCKLLWAVILDGTSFLNFKVGVGAGAGFSYDPDATSPGSDRICGKREALFNIGLYGEANADIPGFSGGVGGDTGIYLGDHVRARSPMSKVDTKVLLALILMSLGKLVEI